MRIGIYGGSFNPIHIGHIKISKIVIKRFKLDKLIFVPAYKNPDKIDHNYASGEDRINMIKLVMPKKAIVSDWELKRNCLSYTFHTINYLKSIYKNDQLFFIIGSDNLEHIDQWEGIEEIVSQCQIICFKRNKKINHKNLKKFNIMLIDDFVFPYSSTSYRMGDLKNVDTKIQKYIGNNYLYLEELLKKANNKKVNLFLGKLNRYYELIIKMLQKNLKEYYINHDFYKTLFLIFTYVFAINKNFESYKNFIDELINWSKKEYKLNLHALKIINKLKINSKFLNEKILQIILEIAFMSSQSKMKENELDLFFYKKIIDVLI